MTEYCGCGHSEDLHDDTGCHAWQPPGLWGGVARCPCSQFIGETQ